MRRINIYSINMRMANSARYGLLAVGLFGFVGFSGCGFNFSIGTSNDDKKDATSTSSITNTTTTTPTASTNTATPSSTGKNTYESVEYGVKMEFPADWESEPLSAPSVIAFVSPVESADDIFAENVNLVTEDLTGKGVTLDEYSEAAVSGVKNVIPDIQQIDYQSTTLAGYPAQKIVYIGSQQDIKLQWMQVWTIVNETAYVFTYTAEPQAFNSYLKDVNEILASFKML